MRKVNKIALTKDYWRLNKIKLQFTGILRNFICKICLTNGTADGILKESKRKGHLHERGCMK